MSYSKEAISGAKWTTYSTIIVTLSQFLQVTLLARILGPTSFGLVGMVTVIINFLIIFSDMGVSNAIIYKQEKDKKVLSSLYWLNIIVGIILFVMLIFFRSFIVDYYNEPRLNKIIILSAFIFIIVPFGQQFAFMLQKELKFKKIAVIEIIASLFGTGIAIVTALLGFKEISLIFGQLLMYTIKSMCLLVYGYSNWRPSLEFNIKEIKGYIKFGLYNMGDNILNYLSSNLDYLIIGGTLGAKALGYYTLAYQLVIFPISKLNPILTKVAFPVFSKIKNDIQLLRRGYLKVINLIALLNFPILIGLLVTSSTLIPLVYGPGWEVTINLIKILCIVGIIRSLGNPLGSLLMSQGKPELGFRLNLITLILQLPTLYYAAKFFGVYGVAIGFIFVQLINIFLNFFTVKIILGKWSKDLLKNIYIEMITSILMGILIIITKGYIIEFNLVIQLLIQVLLGIILYLIIYLLIIKKNIKALKEKLLT
jgi:lipopolysaccharide exporter